jgi:hypothetical protein
LTSLKEKQEFIRLQSDVSVDRYFHLKAVTEVNREGSEELYLKGLLPEALYTSYRDLLEVMEHLYRAGARSWCDVGCGIGRSCFLWSWLFDDTESVGIECVEERLEEARSASRHLPRMKWICADYSAVDFKLPACDVYFLYVATGPRLDQFLAKLKKIPGSPWVVVIESHGDLKPRLNWESWWLPVSPGKFSLSSQRHDPWVSVYQKRAHHLIYELEDMWETRTGVLPDELARHPQPLGYLLSRSNLTQWELVIETQGELWTMDTLGLRWHNNTTLQGEFPQRLVNLSESRVGLRPIDERDPYHTFSKLRRQKSLLHIESKQGFHHEVEIRRIYLSPEPGLELSNGARVHLKDIVSWK